MPRKVAERGLSNRSKPAAVATGKKQISEDKRLAAVDDQGIKPTRGGYHVKCNCGQKARLAAHNCFLLALVAMNCKFSSLPGGKMNMFQGTNAKDGARIKQKLGVDDVKVEYIEIHEQRMQITVQDPAKPKNFDEYTYENGVVTGPKPVEALVIGNQEFTADKTKLFSLSDIDLGLVPEVCRKAAERAQVEDGKPDLISIDWAGVSLTQSKAEKEQRRADEAREFQRQARDGKMDSVFDKLRGKSNDLVVTWRVWIRGPRASKDYWFDAKGKLSEEPY